MSPDPRSSWPELETAFHRALELEPGEREAFCRALERRDPGQARRLRALLDAHRGLDERFLEPATAASDALRGLEREEEHLRSFVGRELGGFRIEPGGGAGPGGGRAAAARHVRRCARRPGASVSARAGRGCGSALRSRSRHRGAAASPPGP